MTEPAKLPNTAYQLGRMEEFMRSTRGDIHELKGAFKEVHDETKQLSRLMTEHTLQASATAQDIGEVKASMDELHSCLKQVKASKKSGKEKWKHIAIGALITIGILAFLVAILIGKDGDLLSTLARILGVLL